MRKYYSQYKFYEGLAKQIVDADYNIHAATHPDHFLLEAARVSRFGIVGRSYRDWVSGLFLNGVYLHSNNYKMGVCITETPHTKLSHGLQNSSANGDPWPKPDEGHWVHNIPAVAQEQVDRTIRIMLQEATGSVIDKAEDLKREQGNKKTKAKHIRQEIERAWS